MRVQVQATAGASSPGVSAQGESIKATGTWHAACLAYGKARLRQQQLYESASIRFSHGQGKSWVQFLESHLALRFPDMRLRGW
jgi:hypothetical protein